MTTAAFTITHNGWTRTVCASHDEDPVKTLLFVAGEAERLAGDPGALDEFLSSFGTWPGDAQW